MFGSWDLDEKMAVSGSEIKHPGSATLVKSDDAAPISAGTRRCAIQIFKLKFFLLKMATVV
jgi:hypothetical protein